MKLEGIKVGGKYVVTDHKPLGADLSEGEIVTVERIGPDGAVYVTDVNGPSSPPWEIYAYLLRPLTLNDTTPEEWDKASKIVYNNNDVDLESEMIRERVAEFEEEAKLSVEEYVGKIGADENSNPLASQVGGSHYKEQKIQPLEYCYATYGLDGLKASVHTKVNKYLTREKGSDLEDVRKAIHCLQILEEKMEDCDEN